MSTKHARKIHETSTSFARWRKMLGMTQAEAAEALGKSRRSIVDYEKSDKPVIPDYCTRVVMAMIATGQSLPTPWPE